MVSHTATLAHLRIHPILSRGVVCLARRCSAMLVLWAAAAIIWGLPANAEEEISAEDAPAYNDLVARAFLIEVEPLVEKYTGWECEWPIPFQLVSRAQYIELSIAEATAEMEKSMERPKAVLLGKRLRPFLEIQAAGLLGRFSTTSGKIFFLPGNLTPTMRALGIEHRFTRDLIEVIMAHELTHAVQNAKFNLREHFARKKSKEEDLVWTMLLEGQASWVQERVADELDLIESAQRFASQMMKKHQEASVASDEEGIMAANMRGYIKGKAFIEAVYAKGGVKAVQRVFDDPPKSSHIIENPELYFLQKGIK